MSEDFKSAAEQWGIPDSSAKEQHNGESPGGKPSDKTERRLPASDTVRRRGFFEAISFPESPRQRLTTLLNEFKQEATDRITRLDEIANVRITNLNDQINQCNSRIQEFRIKLSEAEKYSETEDEKLKELVAQKEAEEQALIVLQGKLTDVRTRLGYAKSGIIDQSLEQAEKQIQKALGIQREIYTQTFSLNKQNYEDNKEYLNALAIHYQKIFDRYEERYAIVKKRLDVLDADGFWGDTTKVLTSIGSISFAISGFLFSSVAQAIDFKNEDILSLMIKGVVTTANKDVSIFYKLAFLLGIILLITLVSFGCHLLLNFLMQRNEKSKTSANFRSSVSKGNEEAQVHFDMKSNNWIMFWVQLIPGVLIAGLMLLMVAATANGDSLEKINASSEGLIAGTGIAITLAGLFYLYIIKVVEPRLLKRHEAAPTQKINWIKANWELSAIVIVFLVASLCFIFLPFSIGSDPDRLTDRSTIYGFLLFAGISLAGAVVFAYGVRNDGLIAISKGLQSAQTHLKYLIAERSGPLAPQVYNNIPEEHGNIVDKVLKQLAYKASVYRSEPKKAPPPPPEKHKMNLWDKLVQFIVNRKEQENSKNAEPIDAITVMEPWEQRYFPHIVEELKAIDFEYKEKKSKIKEAEEAIIDHKDHKDSERRKFEADIIAAEKSIETHQGNIEAAMKELSEDRNDIQREYRVLLTDLLDGFHLGVWYRENGMGPRPGYFDDSVPVASPPPSPAPTLIVSEEPVNPVYE